MVTLEQKLSLFSKLLQQDVRNEIGEKIENMEKEYEVIVDEHKRKVDKKARHIVEQFEKKGEEKRLELLSKARMQNKKRSLAIKEDYVEGFIDKLRDRFIAFRHSAGYKAFMEDLLTQIGDVQNAKHLVVYMLEEDLSVYRTKIVEVFVEKGVNPEALDFEVKNQDLLGGFIIEDTERNRRMDLSVKTLIDDHKDYIVESLFVAIGEVGDTND